MTVQKNDTNNPIQMQKNKKNEQYGSDMNNRTQTFSLSEDRDREVRAIMSEVYNALTEKGYNPINQLVGYLLSEDPTYITNYKNARSLIRRVERDVYKRQVLYRCKAGLRKCTSDPGLRPILRISCQLSARMAFRDKPARLRLRPLQTPKPHRCRE